QTSQGGSMPLMLNSLRGKVVVVDFWTYSCVNCVRTLPYLKAWYDAYRDKGLVIVGVHTPEFEFEKSTANVARAIHELGVTWPVVQDNDYLQWSAYANQYWPAHYFIDAKGRVRYFPNGEGNLTGTWTITPQYVLPSTTGTLQLGFDSRNVFLVVEPVDNGGRISVFVDNKPGTDTSDVKNGALAPRESRMYQLVGLSSAGSHLLRLEVKGRLRLFAFTFG